MGALLFALALRLTPPAKVDDLTVLPPRLQLASVTLTGAGRSNTGAPPPPPPSGQFFFPDGQNLITAAATF